MDDDLHEIHYNRVEKHGKRQMNVGLWPKERKAQENIRTIRLRLYIDPHPQGRPRAARRGNMVIMYPSKADKDYGKEIQMQVSLATASKLIEPLTGPIIAHLEFFIKPPKKIDKKVNYPRGDIDNYVKAILDNIQGGNLLMLNDKQVVRLHAGKVYATSEEPPGVSIALFEVDSE